MTVTAHDGAAWRYAICNELFAPLGAGEVAAAVAALGYQGLELAPYTLAARVTDLTPADRAQIRAQVEAQGPVIVGLHWLLAHTEGLYLNDPEPTVRERTLRYLLAEVDLCADLGGEVLVFGSPAQRNPRPGFSMADAWAWTVEAMYRCGERAAQHGVTFCIEPLPTYECAFITSVDEAAELVNCVGNPGFRMMVDAKAMSYDERPVAEQIRLVAPLMRHMHVNDPNLAGPGMGNLDFRPILNVLRELRYQGWLSVEALDHNTDIHRIARESIANLRRLSPGG